MKRQYNSSYFLLIIYFFSVRELFGYAWLQNERDKYEEFAVRNIFKFEDKFSDKSSSECGSFNFYNRLTSLNLIYYKEKGINDKTNWINKININYNNARFDIEATNDKIANWGDYFENKDTKAKEAKSKSQVNNYNCGENNTIFTEKKYITLQSEFGVRRLLRKMNRYNIASEALIITPNIGANKAYNEKISLRLNFALGGEIPIERKNFYEVMLGIQTGNHKNKISFYSQISTGFNFKYNAVILGYEQAMTDLINTQIIADKNEYNKLLFKYHRQNYEKLRDSINKNLTQYEKNHINKLFIKFIKPINKNNDISLYFCNEWISSVNQHKKNKNNYILLSYTKKFISKK